MGFLSVLSFAHQLWKERIKPGDFLIDATMGNGVDTQMLAQFVRNNGVIHCFDIQKPALLNTQKRLQNFDPTFTSKPEAEVKVEADSDSATPYIYLKNDRGTSIYLHEQSHDKLLYTVPSHLHGTLSVAAFNLGYLPGSEANEKIITTPASTLPALEQTLSLLKPNGGLCTIALYGGHDGGDTEVTTVHKWAQQLDEQHYRVLVYQFINRKGNPPYLIAIEKK